MPGDAMIMPLAVRNGREPVGPVRMAVVGVGYWGPNLVRNLHELAEAELGVICDLNAWALDRMHRRYPAIPVTASFGRVLADESIEAVVLSTPISTHYELAAAALAHGKHVLVEKPLACSSAEALALAETARRAGLVLMPGHTFLYSPPVNIIRELIRSGDLGEIHFTSASRVNLGQHQPDVSVLWDLGPHDFSILRYWFSESPSHVTALSRDCVGSGSPDVAFVSLEFASGMIAHVELSWLAPSKLRRTAIVGSRKMVVYDDTSNEPVRIFDSSAVLRNPESFGEYHLSYRTGDIVSPRVEPCEPLLLELADFCAAVRTGARPRSDAELGLDVVAVIEAAERSLSEGAKVAVERTAGSAEDDFVTALGISQRSPAHERS